ncbi:hypothetical protein KBZ10_16475 [Streptomyces sp. F63]|uniref:hypothetical protein n=1 Tax=Streptomyces sp. F63 TaxID=2824887 RepID=UPI001B388EF9|nr:hypothetical protein [Streptomyces sp. F63]MBQ0986080.1 hypothetical protein [Streptomyces sp. F63]
MKEIKSRLILKPGIDETNMFQIARSRRWSLYDIGNKNSEIYRHIWHSSDGGVEIHYVEDPLTGLNFVTLRGPGAESIEQDIRSSLPVWTYPEALGALRSSDGRDDRLYSAYAAALTAPTTEDEPLVEEMRRMSVDTDPGIRQAVVVATGYCPWPSLVEIVKHLEESDAVENVRDNARLLLEGLERNNT